MLILLKVVKRKENFHKAVAQASLSFVRFDPIRRHRIARLKGKEPASPFPEWIDYERAQEQAHRDANGNLYHGSRHAEHHSVQARGIRVGGKCDLFRHVCQHNLGITSSTARRTERLQYQYR